MSFKLYKHQENAVNFILNNNGNACLWMDCGLGKTLTALKAFELLGAKTMLVVCPLSLINAAWIEDINKFTNFTYCNLRGKKTEAQIYLINYESFSKHKIKTDMIVIDESSKCKNFKSQITKTLLAESHNYKYKIAMSATPAPNNELEFWPQITFVDKSKLNESFYAFRNIYFELVRGDQTIPYVSGLQLADMFKKGFKYKIKKSKSEDFFNKINKVSFWAKKEYCLDLPPKIFTTRDVYLSHAQMKVYKNMKRHMIAEIKDKVIAVHLALVKYLKLRQLTSGFLIDENGEATELADNAKLNVLMEVLEELGDKQIMIFCQFHKEIEEIQNKIKNYATLYSGTKDRDDSISGFKKGRYQYLIGHVRSMAHGLSFTNCDTVIFYSNDYSFEMREQAINRIHRATTTMPCNYIDLVCVGTIDEDILNVLQKKESLQDLYERITNPSKNS